MNKSESVVKLAEALSQAQSEMPPAKFNSTNPFLKNKYADLGAIIDTARPFLAKNGLSVSQLTYSEGEQVGVETVLLHKSGEWISGSVSMAVADEKGKSSAQVAGSIITYLRRYGLSAILGMYTDEDSDGHVVKSVDQTVTVSGVPIKLEITLPSESPKADEPMTIERASKLHSESAGKDYGELTIAELATRFTSYNKALNNNNLTPEERADKEMRRQAVKALITAKKDGSIK